MHYSLTDNEVWLETIDGNTSSKLSSTDYRVDSLDIGYSMYEGRFVFTGNIGSDLHACVRLYTVNDLMNLYALGHITPDFKPVHDKPYINKDIKV